MQLGHSLRVSLPLFLREDLLGGVCGCGCVCICVCQKRLSVPVHEAEAEAGGGRSSAWGTFGTGSPLA